MPFVNVKVIEGVFSTDQKQDIVRKVTDALVEIEGENMRSVTWLVVEEVASGDWASAVPHCTPPTSRLSPQGNPSRSSRLRPADDPPWAVRRAAGE
jgi:4-oxalocrotonate tautomerase